MNGLGSRLKSAYREVCLALKTFWGMMWIPDSVGPRWLLRAIFTIAWVAGSLIALDLVLSAPDPATGSSVVLTFVSIFGTQLWGFVLLGCSLLVGLSIWLKRQLLIALSSMAAMAVWAGYGVGLLQGALVFGEGYRSVVYIAILVSLFFIIFKAATANLKKGED